MKCQYFLAEIESLHILPISSLYVLVAVSNPNEHSISSFFKSPSIVLGQPITWMSMLFSAKYSASKAALVFESSPPIITIAFILCLLHTSWMILNCSSVSNLVLSAPSMSKPPVFLN